MGLMLHCFRFLEVFNGIWRFLMVFLIVEKILLLLGLNVETNGNLHDFGLQAIADGISKKKKIYSIIVNGFNLNTKEYFLEN